MLVRFAFTNVWHHDIEQLTVWEAIKGIGNSLSEGKNHFSNLFFPYDRKMIIEI